MITVEELPSSNANETVDISSPPKESLHSQTPYVHVRTRKKTCLIIFVIVAFLVISLVIVMLKIGLTKKGTRIQRTGVSVAETIMTTTQPILITEIETTTTTSMKIVQVNGHMTWNSNGVTVAGGNSDGAWFDQLNLPTGFDMDDDSSIYIADVYNDRVVRWRLNARSGELLAGGKGSGNRIDQLWAPSDVVIDRKNSSLIICDRGNSRLIRLFHNSPSKQATVLLKTDCNRLAMGNNGDLYLSRFRTDIIQRWKEGEANATTVAGQAKSGTRLDQLFNPEYIFVDEEYSVYISDSFNHRVVKWVKGAQEGVLVAGGHGSGDSLAQLHYPTGLTVDHLGNVYVVDQRNSRVMRFLNGSRMGTIIVGRFEQPNYPLRRPHDISFDRQGNLYVVDTNNHRVQKFDLHH